MILLFKQVLISMTTGGLKLIKIQNYLTKKQCDFFNLKAEKYGISFSEMLRRAMDTYIENDKKNDEVINGNESNKTK